MNLTDVKRFWRKYSIVIGAIAFLLVLAVGGVIVWNLQERQKRKETVAPSAPSSKPKAALPADAVQVQSLTEEPGKPGQYRCEGTANTVKYIFETAPIGSETWTVLQEGTDPVSPIIPDGTQLRCKVCAEDTAADFGTGTDGVLSPAGRFDLLSQSGGGRQYAEAVAYRLEANPSGTTITTLDTPNGIATGDEIMIINLEGTSTDYGDVGNYEFLRVANVDVRARTITTTSPVTKSYKGMSFNNQKVVVQRVPNYTDVTLNTGDILEAAAYEFLNTAPSGAAGRRTGVIAFRVKGTLTIDSGGGIDAEGNGFPEGSICGTYDGCKYNGYPGYGYRGAGWPGGGGGTRAPLSTSGQGGGGGGVHQGQYGSGNLEQMFLGPGGGGGASYDQTSRGAPGGRGGGIMYIFASTIQNSGTLTALGDNGQGATWGGGGGGGAGGTIFITHKSGTLGPGAAALGGAAGTTGNVAGAPNPFLYNGQHGQAGAPGYVKIVQTGSATGGAIDPSKLTCTSDEQANQHKVVVPAKTTPTPTPSASPSPETISCTEGFTDPFDTANDRWTLWNSDSKGTSLLPLPTYQNGVLSTSTKSPAGSEWSSTGAHLKKWLKGDFVISTTIVEPSFGSTTQGLARIAIDNRKYYADNTLNGSRIEWTNFGDANKSILAFRNTKLGKEDGSVDVAVPSGTKNVTLTMQRQGTTVTMYYAIDGQERKQAAQYTNVSAEDMFAYLDNSSVGPDFPQVTAKFDSYLLACALPTASASPSPSITPTPTPSAAASPTPVASATPASRTARCDATCVTSNDCIVGYSCVSGKCRNPACSSESDCVCSAGAAPVAPAPVAQAPVAQASPVAIATPSTLPQSGSTGVLFGSIGIGAALLLMGLFLGL